MKALFAILCSCFLLPEQGIAAAPKPGVCEKAAHDVATYIEHLSWGKVAGYTARTTQAKKDDDRVYTYFVKVGDAKGRSASGYTYQVDVTQDEMSESCIITNVSTDGTDQAE